MAILSNTENKTLSAYEIILLSQNAKVSKANIKRLNNEINTYKKSLDLLSESLKNENNESERKNILCRIKEVTMNIKKTGDIINKYRLEIRSAIQIIQNNTKELLSQIEEEKRKYM